MIDGVWAFRQKYFRINEVWKLTHLFPLREYQDGRLRLLQALEYVDHLRLRLDELHFLNNVEGCGSSPADVHRDRFDERRLGKVLDLLGHRGRE